MQNKPIWRLMGISFVAVMVVSCVTPFLAVDNSSTNNALNRSDAIFPSRGQQCASSLLWNANRWFIFSVFS
jgi:hypothetical protein